jgi:hypothetical protein
LRTRPPSHNPSRPLRVDVLAGDGLLRERLALVERRSALSFRHIDAPAPGELPDVYLVPVRGLRRLCESGGLRLSPDAPPVVAFGSPELLRGAFLAGCGDYLREPWDADELEARLLRLALLRGDRSPSRFGPYVLEGRRLRLPDGREELLSAHEAVVAGLLLANRGEVVSRRALSYALWGMVRGRSRAVDMHISGLRKKIGRDSISCIRGQGYIVD